MAFTVWERKKLKAFISGGDLLPTVVNMTLCCPAHPRVCCAVSYIEPFHNMHTQPAGLRKRGTDFYLQFLNFLFVFYFLFNLHVRRFNTTS